MILAAINTTNGIAQELTNLKLGFLTDTFFLGNTLWQYILFAIVVLLSFAIGKMVYYILKHHVSKITSKTSTRLDDLIIKVLQGPLVAAIFIIGLQYGLAFLTIADEFAAFLSSVLSILVSLTVIWFVMRLSDALIDAYMRPFASKAESQLDENLIPIIKKVVKALILIFGAITIISNFGYDITALITGLGIGGIAVALAAQDSLGNVFGGIAIFTDRPFNIGDRVKIDDKIFGDVVDVGMRSSKIQNLDNNIVIIPNSVLSKSVVENFVRPSKKIRQTFNIGLTYDTKPEKVKEAVEIIKKAVKSGTGVTSDEPLIWFTEFAASSLNLFCVYWIKSLNYWGDSKHTINLKILEELNKAGISIAYPTQTIYLAK